MTEIYQAQQMIEEQRRMFEARKAAPITYAEKLAKSKMSHKEFIKHLESMIPMDVQVNSIYPALLTKKFCMNMMHKIYDILKVSKVKEAKYIKREFNAMIASYAVQMKEEASSQDMQDLEWMTTAWMNDYGFERKVKCLYFAYDNALLNKLESNLASLVAWICTLLTVIDKLNEHEDMTVERLRQYDERIFRNPTDYNFTITRNLRKLLEGLIGVSDHRQLADDSVNTAAIVVRRAMDNDPFLVMLADVRCMQDKGGCDDVNETYICSKCKKPCRDRRELKDKLGV